MTIPNDERRSVRVRASSSRQVKEPDSDVEFWEERESRPKENRFGKRPRAKIYKNSPTRSEKKAKFKRSRSRQTRRKSPASVKYECDDECKVEVKRSNGKVKECGRLCYRKDVHGLKDCERKIHINEREDEKAKNETRFRVPQETASEEENERVLTPSEERILKKGT